MEKNKPRFGKEVIIDLHQCNPKYFTREKITKYFVDLCELIDMQREDLYFWDYEGQEEEYQEAPDHLKGISAVQFIKTSNITIHTLDVLKHVYLNIFSCKDFDDESVKRFTEIYFGGLTVASITIDRK